MAEDILTIKQAAILAGGKGKRLRPITNNLPKPMAPVNGRPFLEHLLLALKRGGISRIVILTGYRANIISEYFGDGEKLALDIRYSQGDVENDTGTRIRNAENLLDDDFFLFYGDNIWPIAISCLSKFYRTKNLPALMAVYRNHDGLGEYGFENNINLSTDGIILKYDRSRSDTGLNAIDIGTFILNKSLIDEMPEHNFSFEKEFIPKLVKTRRLSGYGVDYRYYSITDPVKLEVAGRFLTSKKVLILDRDGVINKKMPEGDYVKNWGEFEFLPGIKKAFSELANKNYKVFVVTNQRGVAKGLMTENDLSDIHEKMVKAVRDCGAQIHGVYSCVHGIGDGCGCRKPKAGLLFAAAKEHHFDITRSIFIGDSPSDIEAGRIAGCWTILADSKNNLYSIVQRLP